MMSDIASFIRKPSNSACQTTQCDDSYDSLSSPPERLRLSHSLKGEVLSRLHKALSRNATNQKLIKEEKVTFVVFEHIPIKESDEPLVDLTEFPFILEPVYFKQQLSKNDRMYARLGVVERLLRIQQRLKYYQFKIWDAWRSRDVQANIYNQYWERLARENSSRAI
jgi:hypothetical protein